MSRDPHAPIRAHLGDADSFRSFGLQFLRGGDFGPAILMFREAGAMILVATAHDLPEHVSPKASLEEMASSIRFFPGGVNGGILKALVTIDMIADRVRSPGMEDGRTMSERVTREDADAVEGALQTLSATMRTHISARIQRERRDWAREDAERAARDADTPSPL